MWRLALLTFPCMIVLLAAPGCLGGAQPEPPTNSLNDAGSAAMDAGTMPPPDGSVSVSDAFMGADAGADAAPASDAGTDGSIMDGDVIDGDVTDGDVTDSDVTDSDVSDAEILDADLSDATFTDADPSDALVGGDDATISDPIP